MDTGNGDSIFNSVSRRILFGFFDFESLFRFECVFFFHVNVIYVSVMLVYCMLKLNLI